MAVSAYATIVPNPPLAEATTACPDPDEVVRLFQAHGNALYRLARVMVRDASEAEDVVQDAFVRLLAHLSAGGDRSNIKSWLFTVAANLCRDRLRRRLRWLPWQPSHERRLLVQPELDRRDPRDVFVAAMRSLSARDRLLLLLKAQGLSYREIAAATGVRDASVGRLLARALARWQKARDATSLA
jgi:RNA polymerase sigma-70 factor (ECF subfamily)